MLDQVVLWEKDIFLWLNSPHTLYLDSLMYLISAKGCWLAVIIGMIYWICRKRTIYEAIYFILFIILMITFSDQISSSIAKPFFARVRPSYHPYTADLVKTAFGDKGWGYGFFSGHASNFFAIAMFTSLAFRKRSYSIIVFFLVFLVAYSRIYLGKHFISDVVVGILFGLFSGWLFYKLYKLSREKLLTYLIRKDIIKRKEIGIEERTLNSPWLLFCKDINKLSLFLVTFLFFLLFFSLDVARIAKGLL